MLKELYFAVVCGIFVVCHGNQENYKVADIDHAHRLNTRAQKYLKTTNTNHAAFIKEHFVRNYKIDDVSARAEKALSAAEDSNYNVSNTCLNHTKLFLEALTRKERWALRMIDSMGKPPSGLLDFHFIWLGSWEECIDVKATVTTSSMTSHPFTGRYCRASFTFGGPMQSSAVGAGVPALEIIIGMCYPSSCSTQDAVGLAQTLESLLPIKHTELLPPTVACQSSDVKYDVEARIVLAICSIFLAVVAVATVYDVILVHWLSPSSDKLSKHGLVNTIAGMNQVVNDSSPLLGVEHTEDRKTVKNEPNVSNVDNRNRTTQETNYKSGTLVKILLSFSVYTNLPKIFGTSQPAGTLTAINGIRFISMTWVVMGHTFDIGHPVVDNVGAYLSEAETRLTFQAIGNETFAVDTFFVLSGLLVSYLSLREMKKRGGMTKFKWGMFYFHRFWRLTPPYMLFMMTYATLSKYLASGPVWPQETGFEPYNCKENWWANLLYINNLVNTDAEMCMSWSWYLANDMQFYVISPLMLIPLYYSPLWGTMSCLVFVLVNFISAGAMSKRDEMGANLLLPNGPVSLYEKPWYRVGPYAVGVFTGYLLYRSQCKVKMPKVVNLIGWLLATSLALLLLYGLYTPDNKEVMSVDMAALYNATSRTVWGACIAWVVYACATGYGGPVNKILSWPAIIPFSRLTYCVYLVHPVILDTYVYSQRTMMHWYDIQLVYMFLGNLCVSYAVALVVSLVYESPMMGMEKALLGRAKNS